MMNSGLGGIQQAPDLSAKLFKQPNKPRIKTFREVCTNAEKDVCKYHHILVIDFEVSTSNAKKELFRYSHASILVDKQYYLGKINTVLCHKIVSYSFNPPDKVFGNLEKIFNTEKRKVIEYPECLHICLKFVTVSNSLGSQLHGLRLEDNARR